MDVVPHRYQCQGSEWRGSLWFDLRLICFGICLSPTSHPAPPNHQKSPTRENFLQEAREGENRTGGGVLEKGLACLAP